MKRGKNRIKEKVEGIYEESVNGLKRGDPNAVPKLLSVEYKTKGD